jgi:hypothetical protein
MRVWDVTGDEIDEWAGKVGPSVLYDVLLMGATSDKRWGEIESSASLTHWLPIAFERIRTSGVVSPDDLALLALRYACRVDDDLGGLPWLTPLLEKNPSIFCRWAEGLESPVGTDDPVNLSSEVAMRILFSWRGVPWNSADPAVRDEKLYEWAKTILDRALANKTHSLIVTFLAIVLQRATEADGTWPALAVRRLLEERSLRELLLDELRVARRNARGATVRSLGEPATPARDGPCHDRRGSRPLHARGFADADSDKIAAQSITFRMERRRRARTARPAGIPGPPAAAFRPTGWQIEPKTMCSAGLPVRREAWPRRLYKLRTRLG